MLFYFYFQEKIFKNFESIRLKPDQFNDYLLSKEIGFSTCTVIDVPYNSSKGKYGKTKCSKISVWK